MAENSTLSDLKEFKNKSAAVRNQLESDWYLSLAYFLGEQWVFWNRGRLDKPRLDDRILEIDNRILPAVTTRIARKTSTHPVFVATPQSYDEQDLNATELATQLLEFDWGHLKLQSRLMSVLLWADICGAGFWKIYWDSSRGDANDFLFYSDSGEPVVDATNRPVRATSVGDLANSEGVEVRTIAKGDVAVDVLSPFELYPDPIAEHMDEAEWFVEEKVRSVEYVKKRYNKEVKPDTDVPPGIVEGRMAQFVSPSSARSGGRHKGVTVYELWKKPGSDARNGKRAVWSSEEVLEESDLSDAPFVSRPYVMFKGVQVPGRFWPTSITSQLRGPQTKLNKIKSQITENAIRFGNPSLMSSRQANVEYFGVPGEHIKYDSTVPDAIPSFLEPPSLPTYVQSEIERVESSITEISGIHEVSKATVPSGVTAASAINLLQEADDTRLGPEIWAMEGSLGEAGTKILQIRARFQDDQRIIAIAGEDGEWNIRDFKKSMLERVSDVEVQSGSQLPSSKAAKQAAMHEFLQLVVQYGIEINPRDLRRFMREYGVGGLENMFATLTESERQIRREHNIMSNGTAIPINDWDEDEVHIEGHNEFRRSRRFSLLPPATQQIINLHVQAHEERQRQIVEQQMQAQMEQMQQMNGGGEVPSAV